MNNRLADCHCTGKKRGRWIKQRPHYQGLDDTCLADEAILQRWIISVALRTAAVK